MMMMMMGSLLIILLVLLVLNPIQCQIQLSKEYVNLCSSEFEFKDNTHKNNTVCSFPKAFNSYTATFHLLEGSFPFNTPDDIRKEAGNIYRSNIQAHSGVGIVLESYPGACAVINPLKNVVCIQMSVEFASNNYTGGIFPNILNNNQQLQWNNNGSVYLTNPINQNNWINSKILTTTTGYIYNQYVVQILDMIIKGNFDIYQPISIVNPNTTSFSSLLQVPEQYVGTILLYPASSYTFTNTSISYLVSKQCAIELLLPPPSTNYMYFTNTAVQVVGLDGGTIEQEVSQWYHNLYQCYYTNITNSNDTCLTDLSSCYTTEPYAYVYNNASSVYKVTLYPNTADITTPLLFRFLITTSTAGSLTAPTLAAADVFVLVVLSIVFVAYCGYLTTRLVKGKTSGSHKEMEGRFLNRIFETYGNAENLKEWNISLNSKPSSMYKYNSSIGTSLYDETTATTTGVGSSWNRTTKSDDIDVSLLIKSDTS